MSTQLDHLILMVNDRDRSIEFYTRILGFTYEGEREPFSVVRVTPDLVLQIAAWGTKGGEHLAFAMTRDEFDQVFGRTSTLAASMATRFTPSATCVGLVTNRVREDRGKPCTSSIRTNT